MSEWVITPPMSAARAREIAGSYDLRALPPTNLIGNALVALQEWPDVKTNLLSKIERLAPNWSGLEADLSIAVDEFLRFESSNQLGNRRALHR